MTARPGRATRAKAAGATGSAGGAHAQVAVPAPGPVVELRQYKIVRGRREEVIPYRQAPEGVPSGPAVFTETVEVGRTVHGPVVAYSEDARSAAT